jgi:hypothetical protein
MEKQFVPYELALRMKEIGFDEPCLASYYTDIPENLLKKKSKNIDYRKQFNGLEYHPLDKNGVEWEPNFIRNTDKTHYVSASTFSQAFRWFREKYIIQSWISSIIDPVGFVYEYRVHIHQEESSVENFDSFEIYKDAELFCLKKLIEIVEKQYF